MRPSASPTRASSALVAAPPPVASRRPRDPDGSAATPGRPSDRAAPQAWAGFTATGRRRTSAPRTSTGRRAPAQPSHEQAVAERIAARVRRTYGLSHTLAAPLTSEHGVIGAIVISRRVADAWPATTRRILGGAALEASTALARVYSHRAAEARASTDALTGLPNRRYFDEFCGLLARRRRAEDAVGVLMVDIDHFKRLNDSHGHDTGDVVLRAVGGAIMSGRPRGRRAGPLRRRGVRRPAAQPEPARSRSRWGSGSGARCATSTCATSACRR